ncbi:MAG: hypothetical protein ACJ790_10200 [Myxococcaceae bacterium]
MIETRACTFEKDPHGFVRATMRDGVEMDLADAKEALAATKELSGGQRVPVLVDSRLVKYQTRQARDYFVSEEAAAICSRVALIIGSPVSRMIGNFFLRNSAHKAPTKLFTDEAAAIDWLLLPGKE